jgi:hypothetical protein
MKQTDKEFEVIVQRGNKRTTMPIIAKNADIAKALAARLLRRRRRLRDRRDPGGRSAEGPETAQQLHRLGRSSRGRDREGVQEMRSVNQTAKALRALPHALVDNEYRMTELEAEEATFTQLGAEPSATETHLGFRNDD